VFVEPGIVGRFDPEAVLVFAWSPFVMRHEERGVQGQGCINLIDH
jgi:hypothetical protein